MKTDNSDSNTRMLQGSLCFSVCKVTKDLKTLQILVSH